MVCETVITNTVYQQVSSMENGDFYFMLFGRVVAAFFVAWIAWKILKAGTNRNADY